MKEYEVTVVVRFSVNTLTAATQIARDVEMSLLENMDIDYVDVSEPEEMEDE